MIEHRDSGMVGMYTVLDSVFTTKQGYEIGLDSLCDEGSLWKIMVIRGYDSRVLL